MTLDQFSQLIWPNAPLIASVQASPGSAVDDPETLLKLAQASLDQGVKVLRLEGEANIRHICAATQATTIGLIKRQYPGSEVYITPTLAEIQVLLECEVEVVALDGTPRPRPGGASLSGLIDEVHRAGRLAMADIDSVDSAKYAADCGADILSTTLSGYTAESPHADGPDLELVRQLSEFSSLLIAEGRYASPDQARLALRAGAQGVVVGGALNDPVKQTRAFLQAAGPADAEVGAVDIGGTWMRFGLVDASGKMRHQVQIPLPASPEERVRWIEEQCGAHGVTKLGISSGGVIDPLSRRVIEAKAIIPGHVGTHFAFPGIEVQALNDGLATGWGHAMHPRYAGKRVVTLALGTGVGCSIVDGSRILMGRDGNYPRLNDLPGPGGMPFEKLLGGAILSKQPSPEAKSHAREAALYAVELVSKLLHPDVIVVCGGVGLADWLELDGVERSPYGEDAGLVGAGMLALYPPVLRVGG